MLAQTPITGDHVTAIIAIFAATLAGLLAILRGQTGVLRSMAAKQGQNSERLAGLAKANEKAHEDITERLDRTPRLTADLIRIRGSNDENKRDTA